MVVIMSEKIKINPHISSESIDQGVHNYIARFKKQIFKNPQIKECGDFIATIGLTCQKDPDSLMVNDGFLEVNGTRPTIVHQYNRSQEIINFYGEKYKN